MVLARVNGAASKYDKTHGALIADFATRIQVKDRSTNKLIIKNTETSIDKPASTIGQQMHS